MRATEILGVALVAAMATCGGCGALAADGPIGAVERVTPEAFGTPPGAARGALGRRDPVVTDETLETGADGTLHLRLIDDSDLWLDHDSLMVLDELIFDPATKAGEYVAELSVGLFRFVTGSLQHEAYEVRTPTVIVGVRGTDFAISVARDGATRITVYAGLLVLRLRAGGRAMVIEPPFTATIAKPNGPILASPFVWPVYPGPASVSDRPLPGTSGGAAGDPNKAGKVGINPSDGGGGGQGIAGQPRGGAGGSVGGGSGSGN